MLQTLLDGLYWLRRGLACLLAYLSLRLYAIDVSAADVWKGRYRTVQYDDLNLDRATDTALLLDTAKAGLQVANDRRATVADKFRTLLTVSSLLLGIIALLLPGVIRLDAWWPRTLFFIAMAALLNSIVLLLVFFDVGADADIIIDQDDVALSTSNLQKSLINQHRRCHASLDNRTNYLVDLYKAGRFFFLIALTLVVAALATSYAAPAALDPTERIIHRLRGEPSLTELLRGPKGEQGAPGLTGEPGVPGASAQPPWQDVEAIVEQMLSDPRFQGLLTTQIPEDSSSADR